MEQQKQKVIEPAKKPIRRKTVTQCHINKQVFPDECEFPYSMYKRNYISEEQRNGHTHR